MKILIILLAILLSGCTLSHRVRIETKPPIEAPKDTKTERDGILEVFNDDRLILLAYEKRYFETFDIAKNFYQYKKTEDPTYDGFWVWLSKNLWYKYIFEKGDPWGIGEDILNRRFQNQDYIDIRKNYEVLKELADKNALYEGEVYEKTE